MKAGGKETYETVATFRGSELEYMKAQHPFLDRTSLVIVGDHVTLESGTGCVTRLPALVWRTLTSARSIPNCRSLCL